MAQTSLNSTGVASSGSLALQSNGTTTAVTIDTSQNVGIGTSSPAQLLDVQSATSPTIRISNSKEWTSGDSGVIAAYQFYTKDASTPNGTKIAAYINSENYAGSSVPEGILTFGTSAGGGSSTNATEKMRLDSSGNLGLGVTPSAWGSYKAMELGYAGNSIYGYATGQTVGMGLNSYYNAGWKYAGTGTAARYLQDSGAHSWYTAGSGTAGNAISFTQAMTLDASGNLGIGTTSPSGRLDVTGGSVYISTNNNYLYGKQTSGSNRALLGIDASDYTFNGAYSGFIWNIQGGEKMRLDSSGNLLVGTTSYNAGTDSHTRCHFYTADNAGYVASFYHAGTPAAGMLIKYATAINGTGSPFVTCNDGSERATIRSNGGLANYSANNVNLSDERTKTDIVDAGNYLAKICAIPVRTFKYKDQTDDLLNLGVIAQEVEAVAPELVDTTGFGETPEDGVPLKAIYQTDLQYALMKALQELNAKFEAYKATHP